nr:LLM class flavin-dependent oxidoreductase [Micromonospora sp. DSM 115978]
ELLRQVWRREGPVVSDGPHYPLPYPGADGAGLGKPLKITVHPLRERIPVYLGAEGPRNVALAAEIADGWLPIFYDPQRSPALYEDSLAGAPDDFTIACPVTVVVDDDVETALSYVKWSLAFYIGGMGAPSMNFHADVIGRMGFAEQAEQVAKLVRAGDREAAVRAVPDELADGISLVGPLARI